MNSILRRLCFLLGAGCVVLVVLPAVHECGHYLPGVLLGAQVRDVTWTLLGGRAPKVSFTSVPDLAMPWIDAGGVILPTILGLVLVFIWARCSTRVRSPFWLLLLIAGVGLSCNAFGTAVEAFSSATSYAHLRGVAHYFGLSGAAAIGLQLIPMLLVLPAFYYAFVRFRLLRRATPLA